MATNRGQRPSNQRWLWLGLIVLLGGVGWYVFSGRTTVPGRPTANATKPRPANVPMGFSPRHQQLTPRQPQAPPMLFKPNQVAVAPPPPTQSAAPVKLTPTSASGTLPGGLNNPVAVGREMARLQPVWASPERTRVWPQVRYELPSGKEMDLMRRVLQEDMGPDSTAFEVLSRHLRRWPNAVIVCDLTTSMDPYAAQIYAWFRRNARHPGVLGTLFFTDCDSLGQETQPGGPPGTFFVTTEQDPRAALPTLLAAARNTANNRLNEENVVEALQYAQCTFLKARHLVLLADNGSGVKDMALLPGINRPVHVIACGQTANGQQPFEPDQYQIAARTKGSVHTLDDDLVQPATIEHNTFVRIGPTYFRYVSRRGRFVKTHFTRRPVRFLGINW